MIFGGLAGPNAAVKTSQGLTRIVGAVVAMR